MTYRKILAEFRKRLRNAGAPYLEGNCSRNVREHSWAIQSILEKLAEKEPVKNKDDGEGG